MSNPNTFINTYSSKIVQLCGLIQDLRGMNDQIDQDPTLLTRYFAQTPTGPGGATPRTDIVAADVTGAHDALNQVIIAFDSGAPTQKSKIFKMLP